MSRRAPDPRTVRTRAAILNAATSLLDDATSDNASISRIADAAGVSVGSVYLHFDHRDALIAQMIDVAFDRQTELFSTARERADSPLERVLAFGDALLTFALVEPVAFRSLATRVLEPPPTERRSPTAALDALLTLLDEDLAAAVDVGEIAEQPLDAARIVLVGTWTGVATQLVRRDDRAIDADTAATVQQTARGLVLAGLRPVTTV